MEDDDDDDFERDSIGSSQTGSTRIRLQDRWRIIGTRDKATSSADDIKQWIEDHANAEMAKAGQFEDLHPAPTDVGGWKRAHVSNCTSYHAVYFGALIWLLSVQGYRSTTERATGLLNRTQYNCPYRRTCECYVALSVKEFRDRFILLQAGEHTLQSHVRSSGILNPKQKGAVARAARSAPLALGSQIHANMQNFSPGRQVPYDKRSRKAVARLVNKTRRDVMSSRVGGIDLDGSEGAMNQLAESLSLVKFLERHNDPNDPFHMSEHQPVCVGHQFKDGISFMTITTCHFLGNMSRAVNSASQTQGHFDGAFNWCKKNFGLIGFGMNSLGAHFNPVSVSIVNSESKDAIKWAYEATCNGLYTLYNSAVLCQDPSCGFCTQVLDQVSGEDGALWKQHLLSDDAARLHYKLDKPSSDSTISFFSWAKEKFGVESEVQQCGFHLSSKSMF